MRTAKWTLGALMGGVCVLCLVPSAHGAAGRVSLIDAVKSDDVRSLRSLLAQKSSVNEAGPDGMTALHWAVYADDLDVARLLIEAQANVDAFNSNRAITPLILASSNGNAAMIDLLLKAGADPNVPNRLGTTPLMRAAAAGCIDCVKVLLNHGAEINRKEIDREQTALMFAAAMNRATVIRALAAAGADLNLTSKTVASTNDLLDEDGNPIPAASRTGATQRQTKGDGLSKGLGGRTALHYAAREGHLDSVIALVEAGADVNKVDPLDGSSALVVAISNGYYDVAKYLADHGANPNLAMSDGLAALYATLEAQWAPVSWTPTAFTAANGIVQQATSYLDLMKDLLAHGADPNARITKTLWFSPPHHNISWVKAAGASPFWRAAQADDVPAMELLRAAGADPHLVPDDKTTPLAAAAGVGWAGNFSTNAPNSFLSAVQYLTDKIGIDVNTPNTAGYTALMGAAWRGDNEMIHFLVSKGAKTEVRNQRGWSATDMANGPFIRGSEVPIKHPDTIALLQTLGGPAPISTADGEEILGAVRRGGEPAEGQQDGADGGAAGTQRRNRK